RQRLQIHARQLKSPAVQKRTRSLEDGAVIIREWAGRSYEIAVSAKGYVYDGKTYRSLSAIARLITGARWSGPRFFGLTA
ncbi:MAG: DUF2924 domain-containing protein, partial [Caulobacterales bacterium]